MDYLLALGVVAAALFVLVVLGMARMAWRIVRHDEQPEPGGSYGRQVFGRAEQTPRRARRSKARADSS